MQAPPEIAGIERDIAFQRRVWRAERIGWVGMALVVIAAAIGVFGGGGPLADGAMRAGDVEVAWPRMARLGRAEGVHVTLPPGPGMVELRLPPELAAAWRQRDATPAPAAATDGVLRFARDASGAARITLHMEPIGPPGPRRLRIIAAGQAFDLPVFVWP